MSNMLLMYFLFFLAGALLLYIVGFIKTWGHLVALGIGYWGTIVAYLVVFGG